MPRARAFAAYPPAFWEIMERVVVKGETIGKEVEDKRAAMRLQGKFYAYRQAIKREIALMARRPEDYSKGQLESMQQLDSWAQMTVCWFDRSLPDGVPCRINFMHRDKTPEALMLQQMLDANPSTGAPQAKPAEEESMKRLLEKLGQAAPADTTKKYY